ncbi:7686_t:CDS:2 [Racocetra fulgida]|uniref:7686_t:CDS:1 n=1 Tax=Racocetra fulgida TaxID=60492 RepID=A0A9N8VQL2_9GLOM|nr:7686_t:CDS:2 [Racocetra fulgida]
MGDSVTDVPENVIQKFLKKFSKTERLRNKKKLRKGKKNDIIFNRAKNKKKNLTNFPQEFTKTVTNQKVIKAIKAINGN